MYRIDARDESGVVRFMETVDSEKEAEELVDLYKFFDVYREWTFSIVFTGW